MNLIFFGLFFFHQILSAIPAGYKDFKNTSIPDIQAKKTSSISFIYKNIKNKTIQIMNNITVFSFKKDTAEFVFHHCMKVSILRIGKNGVLA